MSGVHGRSPGRGLHSVVQSPILCIVTRSAGGKLPPAVGEFAPISVRTDNKLMEEQNCCSQGGRGETRPALTQFPARDGATGDDIRALQYLH